MIEINDYVRRILVIDDNDSIHKDYQKVLCGADSDTDLLDLENSFFGEATEEIQQIELNVQLDHAYQGKDGVKMLEESLDSGHPYDMAFVDMRMPPGWDGLKTIQELWKVDSDLEVVICSAYSDHSWSEIVGTLGRCPNLFILKKPFENTEVAQIALALTEKRRFAKIAALKMNQITELVAERTEELRQQKMEADTMLSDLISIVGDGFQVPSQ